MRVRVHTTGSVWLIDEERKVYFRFPLTEAERWSPEGEDWGGPGAGSLQDAVPHPFDSWEIVEHRMMRVPGFDFRVKVPGRRLIIHGPEGGVDAPNPEIR